MVSVCLGCRSLLLLVLLLALMLLWLLRKGRPSFHRQSLSSSLPPALPRHWSAHLLHPRSTPLLHPRSAVLPHPLRWRQV